MMSVWAVIRATTLCPDCVGDGRMGEGMMTRLLAGERASALMGMPGRVVAALALVGAAMAIMMAAAPPSAAVLPYIRGIRTDGQTVAWVYQYYESTAYVQPLGTGSPRDVAHNVGSLDVSGDRVVWDLLSPSGMQLGGISMSSGDPLSLPNLPGINENPSLSGSRLVWLNRPASDQPWQVVTADLSAAAPPQVLATAPADAVSIGRPAVSGSLVVWTLAFGPAGGPGAYAELWTAKVGGIPARIVTVPGTYTFFTGYDVGGTWIVYGAEDRIHLVNLAGVTTDHVISDHGRGPTTDGRYVFWEDESTATQFRGDIVGYDIQTDSSVAAAIDNGGINTQVWARGGAVAWNYLQAYTYGGVVQAHRITEILPSARQPDPGTTDPAWTYFPETGHYLASGFRSFWQHSGGLPVFGYPLTEEFTQHDLTVQYLERQRLEYHPEHAGTPYEVELGRLGAEAVAVHVQTQTVDSPFQPLPADTPSDATCQFYPQTGHRLCAGFNAYWQSHGLEFGDPGVSAREALALFGYPLSEEYTDPTTGLTVQWFERARFEYHPNTPEPYKVLLGRLGADVLADQGWGW
jgi:hypothetical protein